jgi:alpha-glucoside transport system permease protein
MSAEAHEVLLEPPAEPPLRSVRRRMSSPVATGVVILITVLWTIPTVGLFVTSVRPVWLTKGSGWWTVFEDRTVTWDNYAQVLSGGDILPDGIAPYFFNTVAIVVPATIIPILLACMVAYAIAWIPFRGANVIFVAIVALQVLPIQMTLLPLLVMFSNGWSIGSFPIFPNLDNPETGRSLLMGSYVPLWLVHTAVSLPLAVFLIHNAMARLPREIIDAARIDGASHYVIFLRMALPLSTPAIAAFAIFQFLWVWNDYIVALTFAGSGPDVAPVTPYLARLAGGFGFHEHLLTAGAFVVIIIPVVVFFALQRHFQRGLTLGSTDG